MDADLSTLKILNGEIHEKKCSKTGRNEVKRGDLTLTPILPDKSEKTIVTHQFSASLAT
tara:strand:- start:484 stop:660 length:177 start_codon:yes stop_codon:yes gene_type:complete